MGRCRLWSCGVLCHPTLSSLLGPRAGLSWGPCCAPLSAPTKGSCPEKQRWVHSEIWVDTAGHTESGCAIKHTGVCPSVHPGRSRPGQGEAGWLEKPHLGCYIPVLSCTPWPTTCIKLLFIVWARNTHFSAFNPSPTHLPSHFWNWILWVTWGGTDFLCSKLSRRGERYVCRACPFW